MRSIAEYFRDLAADDRYFGAEPPTPDAEMLHRIAEREIQRRVEAKVEDNGVVLRQIDDQSDKPTTIADPVTEELVAEEPVLEEAAADEPVESPAADEVAEPAPEPQDDSVAAKLARIRAAVARSRTETEPLLNSVFAEDEHAESYVARVQETVPTPAPEIAADNSEDEAFEDEAEADVDDLSPEAETEIVEVAEDETPDDEIHEDEIAAESPFVDTTGVTRPLQMPAAEPGAAEADLPGETVAEDEDTESAESIDDALAAAMEPDQDQPDELADDDELVAELDEVEAKDDVAENEEIGAESDGSEFELSDEAAKGSSEMDEPAEDLAEAPTETDDFEPELSEEVSEELPEDEADIDELAKLDGVTEAGLSADEADESGAAAEAQAEQPESDAADDDDLTATLAALDETGGETAVEEAPEPAQSYGTDESAIEDALAKLMGEAPGAQSGAENTSADTAEDAAEDDADVFAGFAETTTEDMSGELVMDEDDVEDAAAVEDMESDLAATLASLTGADDGETDAADLTGDTDDGLPKLVLGEEDLAELAPEAAEAALDAPRVRVMKMSRAEFDQQFEDVEEAHDDSEESSPKPGDTDVIREAVGPTGLSSEDEDDLIRELAEVELEGATSQEDASETDTAEVSAEMVETPSDVAETLEALAAEASDGKAARIDRSSAPAAGADDASVERLLARADDALGDQEGTRRRSAISHLKAAVAAVRADGSSAREEAEAEAAKNIDQYRDDLASVVRPDSPDASDTHKPAPVRVHTRPRPDPEQDADNADPATSSRRRRMPPLMLVSEQRVDKGEEAESSEPVHPRRVQADDLDKELENELFTEGTDSGAEQTAGNIFTDTDDFKGYVAETGAEGVPELLEASLAFGQIVEGSQFNTRPQIMKRMLSLFDDDSVTREDGLRAFGVLLREGRIHRIQRGQFMLSETSRFQPETKPKANSA